MSHVEDLACLRRMKDAIRDANATKLVLDEVLNASVHVQNYTHSNGMCYAKANYTNRAVTGFDIFYEHGNMGNLVHELTHVVNHLCYRRNFVNYDDKTANPTEEEFNQNGTICTNEAVRQNQWRNGNGDTSRTRNLSQLRRYVENRELHADVKAQILTKLDYGISNPHLEYSTVLHQILIWCSFGVPFKKPVKDAQGQVKSDPTGQIVTSASLMGVSAPELTQTVSVFVEEEWKARQRAAPVTGGASQYNL